jgi:hypothetical protein
MVNILSIDVGIKNLSFCLLRVVESLHDHTIEIVKWDVINVSNPISNEASTIPSNDEKKHMCTLKHGCKLKAAYAYVSDINSNQTGNIKYTCKRHFKLTSSMKDRCIFEQKPKDILKVLNKSTIEKMRDFCKQHSSDKKDEIEIDKLKHKSELKKQIVEILHNKYIYPITVASECIHAFLNGISEKEVDGSNNNTDNNTDNNNDNNPVNKRLPASASTVSLVLVGFNIMKHFDKLFYHTDACSIDCVVIENQISPIANRMKTIQGMITQYFLMKGVDKNKIIYFSAVQKLKIAPYHFICYKKEDADEIDDIQTYDERKKAGVACVRKILSRTKRFSSNPMSPHTPTSPSTPKLFTIYNPYNPNIGDAVVSKHNWLDSFENHSKKDDLADSFLQGLSYIVKNHSV